MNKGNAKPKVVTSTANEVIQLQKSEPLKSLGKEMKKTRSEGDKSLKEKSKDKPNSIRKRGESLEDLKPLFTKSMT